MTLLSNRELESSDVVANCVMNRERRLRGTNGYDRELGLDIAQFLLSKIASKAHVAWLDLCCGEGFALEEAAGLFRLQNLLNQVCLTGVDLVGGWALRDATRDVEFVQASLDTWTPDRDYDLITCVHGLHYIGDKLALIRNAASSLKGTGCFVANLDLANLHVIDCLHGQRAIIAKLKTVGVRYDSHTKVLRCDGNTAFDLPFRYVGADDQTGPNYTGQPAVTSHYVALHGATDA